MEYKTLGTSQVRVPEIGLGTWKYSGGVVPLRAGIAHGACLIDTAEIYGTEEVVGEAIRDCRERMFIATKAAPRNFRRDRLIAAAEASLRRLGTDYIDLYQLHWPNFAVPIEETMAAMEELVDSGKVRFIGVSNFSIAELKSAQAALSKHKIVSNQVRYNLIERTIEGGLLKYCRDSGITVIAYTPLGSGRSHLLAHDRDGTLAGISETSGKTEAQIALSWVLAKEGVIAIPKASSVAHAVEDCAASGWRISLADFEALNKRIRFKRRGRFLSALQRYRRNAYQLAGRKI